MGGHVSATSQVGAGSTFRLELTLPIALTLPMYRPYGAITFDDLSVLIVDDDQTSLQALAKTVRGLGVNSVLQQRVRMPSNNSGRHWSVSNHLMLF